MVYKSKLELRIYTYVLVDDSLTPASFQFISGHTRLEAFPLLIVQIVCFYHLQSFSYCMVIMWLVIFISYWVLRENTRFPVFLGPVIFFKALLYN